MEVKVFKKVNDFKIDFNTLSSLIDVFPDNASTKGLRVKIKPVNTVQIEDLRSQIKSSLKYNLLDCDIYASLSAFHAGTNQHVDQESVFILNCCGKVCYNIYEEEIHSYIIEEQDAIFIPSGVVHSAVPLTPRISLSFRVENGINT